MSEHTIWEAKLKPLGGLGRLEGLVNFFVEKGISPPRDFDNYRVVVMAGDNGISREGISIYSPADSVRIVQAHLEEAAATPVFLSRIGKEEILVDVGLFSPVDSGRVWDYRIRPGSGNFLVEPAMTREEAVQALEAGARVAARLDGLDIVGIGEIGVGNTVAAVAALAALLDLPAGQLADRGSGVSDSVLSRRISIIEKAIALHQPCPGDVLDAVSKVGGVTLAAMTGFIIGAGEKRLPVMLDGFVASVAALLATRLSGTCRELLVASHLSREKGHRLVLRELGLVPLFDFDLNYGEGLGAALGLFLCELAFVFSRRITQMS